MANICDSFSPIKETIIYDYIIEKIPATKNLSQQYVNAYLQGIKPAREDFYKALEAVSAKNPDEAEEMVKEIVKICLADGQLHYNEKTLSCGDIPNLARAGRRAGSRSIVSAAFASTSRCCLLLRPNCGWPVIAP